MSECTSRCHVVLSTLFYAVDMKRACLILVFYCFQPFGVSSSNSRSLPDRDCSDEGGHLSGRVHY